MIIGSLASTADSDLSALSSIMMADIYGRAGKRKANPRLMLTVGRATMVVATGAALYFAGARMNILDLLVLVGAIWGALVFPVIASFYWEKVTNKAFTVSVLAALAVFFPVRFGLIPMGGGVGYVFDVVAVIGVGVVAGLMTFGFFGAKAARIVGVLAALIAAPFAIGFLHDYAVLSGSLIAYAVSTVVCVLMSVSNTKRFDFSSIAGMTGNFDVEAPDLAAARAETPAAGSPVIQTH
jgi:Na+/proline symporter